jgi:hypothetical protein
MAVVASAETAHALARTGDSYASRLDGLAGGLVPEATALARGDATALAALEAALEGEARFDRDAELTAVAWALGERGDASAAPALARLVQGGLDGDLLVATHAATHALLGLVAPSRRNLATYSYSGLAMREAVALAPPSTASYAPLGASPKSCRRRVLLLGADGQPVTYAVAGEARVAAVEGTEFVDVSVTPIVARYAVEEVAAGGGTFVPDHDGGQPSRRWNCAGYAFRELVGGRGWNAFAPDVLRTLVDAGLLRVKSGAPAKGDKVFYFPPAWVVLTSDVPAHVAEVERVEGGVAVVRGPDNSTGVFDAAIGAAYFTDRKWTAVVYEWASGVPAAKDDPATATDPAYCNHAAGACGDGKCDGGEDLWACPGDCFCGNGTCDPSETPYGCEQDCNVCGDTYCAGDETPKTCEADCGHCGNGTCETDLDECKVSEVGGGYYCEDDCCVGGANQCGDDSDVFCQ